MAAVAPLTIRASRRHRFTQRTQVMHFLPSAVSVSGSIACTGRLFAQAPHFTQSFPALGANPPLPLSCRVGCPEWRLPIPISLQSVVQTAPAASHLTHLPFFFSRSIATAGARCGRPSLRSRPDFSTATLSISPSRPRVHASQSSVLHTFLARKRTETTPKSPRINRST